MLILRNPAMIAFEAISDVGTVHGAAERLGLTQTAVTLRLKTLESELGMTLFLRSRKGMSLTEEGKALLQLCRGQRELEGQFLGQVSGANRANVSLTIIGPTSVITGRVVQNCKHLYEKYPFLSLHFRVEDHENLIELIRKGIADLAIVPPSLVPNEMDSKFIKADRYILVGSSKWKGRRLIDILENERIIDFYESDQATTKYLKHFNLEKLIKKDRLYVNNNDALIQLFMEGIGFGTLTESVAKNYIDSGQIIALNQGRTVDDSLALIWYPRPAKQPYFEDILKSIR